MDTLFILMSLLYVGSVAAFWYLHTKRTEDLKHNYETAILSEKETSSIERVAYEQRLSELESGIESGYGVKVRRIINRVECDFSMHELGWIMQGLLKVIENPQIEYLTKKHVMEMVDKAMEIAGIIAEESKDPNAKKEIKLLHKSLEKSGV